MFGLMKPRGCGHNHSAESAAHRRLHYCGTCKTMGKMYGQRSRMLLNNDAVFLAELLTALGPDLGSVKSWAKPLQSYNCASLPIEESQMPLALRIASAATLVMSEMKLKDQIEDNPKSGFKLLGKLYSESFFRAAAHLKEWGVPIDTLWAWCRTQHEREAEVRSNLETRDTSVTLSYLAEPTAQMTGLVFLHAAAAIGACEDAQEKMRSVGSEFGALIYVLDAFEDDKKDARRGEFNALQAAFGVAGQPLSAELHQQATAIIQVTGETVESAIIGLPIPARESRMYARRLAANVTHKLGLPEAKSCCIPKPLSHTQAEESRTTRWQKAHRTATRLTAQHRTECAGLVGTVKAPFIFATVLLTALVFPREAMSAASYRDCMGVLFNLMFWGAAFNAVLAMPQRLTPSYRAAGGPSLMSPMDGGIPHSSSGGTHQTTVVTETRIRRRRPCCCFGCDCDCCCDGCCDACNCACCTCEACECANCACDSCSGC